MDTLIMFERDFYMNQLSKKRLEIREIDQLTKMSSVIHQMDAFGKLLITVLYIVTVVSFPKYEISGLMIFVLYPVLILQLAGLPLKLCFYKMRFVIPLVAAVGIVNPFLDHTPIFRLGTVMITGGMLSMLTLLMKGVYALMASFVLVATTPIDEFCGALRRIHVPDILVTLLLLTYRYVGLMLEETGIMYDAYMLRAPGQTGIHISAWGSFLGQLLLRSMDRGEELYHSMLLRGYHGEFYYADTDKNKKATIVYVIVCIVFFFIARFMNVTKLIGMLVLS